jgi:stearoyl-CoA desaturase (Delta-9 desaturase)
MNLARKDRSDGVISSYSVAFVSIHLACLAVIWTGVSSRAVVLGLALYVVRIFAMGAGYHRYFAHRAFQTSRVFQFGLAFLSLTSAQRGILWWAAKHRQHHMHSDADAELHSPVRRGFLYAHIGWIFLLRNDATDYGLVKDLVRFKELVWLERHSYLPLTALAFSTWLIADWAGLVIGFCWSTVAVWHVTFSINSLSHLIGRRRYITGDHSRNNWLLASDHGGGLAQQSPRVPGVCPPRISVVGTRHDLLRTVRFLVGRACLGSSCPAGGCDERRT